MKNHPNSNICPYRYYHTKININFSPVFRTPDEIMSGFYPMRQNSKSYLMNHKLLFFFLSFSFGTAVYSQQLPLLTQYMYINMAFNPGYAGSSDGINVTGLARQQWIGFKDANGGSTAPQDFFLTIDSPIKFLHGGVGGSITDDMLGPFSTVQLKI